MAAVAAAVAAAGPAAVAVAAVAPANVKSECRAQNEREGGFGAG